MADTSPTSEIVPGARVHYRATFGRPGTVVAVHGVWAWVMFDDYPDDAEAFETAFLTLDGGHG